MSFTEEEKRLRAYQATVRHKMARALRKQCQHFGCPVMDVAYKCEKHLKIANGYNRKHRAKQKEVKRGLS